MSTTTGTHFFFKMEYQHIIIGGGCAGFQLAKTMLELPKESIRSILIIESSKVHAPKSWCFWSTISHPYRHLVEKEWHSLGFKAYQNQKNLPLQHQTYQYIDSTSFISHHLSLFAKDPRLTIVYQTVSGIEETENGCLVQCENGAYHSEYVYNSVPHLQEKPYFKPKVWQHFLGWEITTSENSFDTEKATLMDFDVDKNEDGRFIYILPFTEKRALVECTVFSTQEYALESFECSLRSYLEKKYSNDYTISKIERGTIPMMPKINAEITKRIIPIGTAAGCIKASTGYSFTRNLEHTTKIIGYLQGNNKRPKYAYSRFTFYDKLLLWIIENQQSEIKKIFYLLFKNNSIKNIFMFLDERTSIVQDLRIFYFLPKRTFIKALIKSKLVDLAPIKFTKKIYLGSIKTAFTFWQKNEVVSIQKNIIE
jgi:lycopene beta-cyclase